MTYIPLTQNKSFIAQSLSCTGLLSALINVALDLPLGWLMYEGWVVLVKLHLMFVVFTSGCAFPCPAGKFAVDLSRSMTLHQGAHEESKKTSAADPIELLQVNCQ